MIMKLVGSVMVLISCLATSRIISALEHEKNERLDSFITLIRYIRNKIDCYSVPIDKILADCPEEIIDPLGGKETGMTFEDILHRKNNLIGDDSRRILEEFSKTLGKNYRERQLKLCDGAISALEVIRDTEVKKYSAKKKTVNALCFAVGGLIIILLL